MRLQNLQYYLSQCRLPQLPVNQVLPYTGHKSHKNQLQVRPEFWRRLEAIHSLNSAAISVEATEFANQFPQHPVDTDNDAPDECFTIPVDRLVPTTDFESPGSIEGIQNWVYEMPLRTVQCAMHIIFPETRNHTFHAVDLDDDVDSVELFRAFSWSGKGQETGTSSNARVVIAFQPPWVLSYRDIKMFTKCTSFPPYYPYGHANPLSEHLESPHRLWAKVYDLCVKQRTRWFVLTSSHDWVFGVFSQGWTHAFVTNVGTSDCINPTIVELLIFWVASAMRMQSTASIPKYPEPVENVLTPISIPSEMTDPIDYSKMPASESQWTGKSDEPASSAGIRFSSASSVASTTATGAPPVNTIQYNTILKANDVKNWCVSAAGAVMDPNTKENIKCSYQHVVVNCSELAGMQLGEWLA